MTVDNELLAELIAKPVGPQMPRKASSPDDATQELEVRGDSLTATVSGAAGEVTEGTARDFIASEGLDPAEWEISTWKKGKYGKTWVDEDGNRQWAMETIRFTFKRRQEGASEAPNLVDDAIRSLESYQPVYGRSGGSHGFLVLIGDMQFGKIDGDGPAGTLARTIDCLNRAADALEMYRKVMDIGHVHIAWLGDHVEGFVSQGGANVWRTVLTLNEQIRLTHAVMLHALKLFAPKAEKVSMVAVPGNHGEPVRFEGKGTTRYDDSHDTEALISIANTIKALEVPGFEHVKFYVPDTDELTVRCEVAGTRVLHTHGHKFGSKKDAHMEWWKGQEFGTDQLPSHLLVAGHLHHEFQTENFIQVPAMESESTWWRHLKGGRSRPGLTVAITKDGDTPIKHTIYGQRPEK